ncbi:MAG: hypothetical protein HFE73_01935 [Firmicutes bacterium]|nr:hypothetical protein [Bacillota bacterium]
MKKNSYIVICGAVLFLIFLSVGTLLKEDVSFSPNENRYLQEKPEFSGENILSGRFAEQAEKYLSDQIIGREGWVAGKSMTEAALGIFDMNGVYLCKDGRVVERFTEETFDWSQYKRNLQQISQLKEICDQEQIPLDLLMVPTAAYVYKDALPVHALTFDEDKAFAQAETIVQKSLIDLRKVLIDENKYPTFFKTDHHWTGYGAFLAYQAYMERLGADVSQMSYEDTEPAALSDEFKGTLYSKVLLSTLGMDTIMTPSMALEANYKVSIEGKEYDSLYFNDYLKEKDKYAVYFGGNYDRVDVDTESENGEKLLIIKDSFANSFVPYLLDDFHKITMVDTRFYRDDISALAKEYDRVLILYSVSNLAEERLNLTQALLK